MAGAAILYYSPPGNKRANKTRALIVRLGVRLICVPDEDVHKTVEELIGKEEIRELDFGADERLEALHSGEGETLKEVKIPQKITEEIMVFFNFTEALFERVLRELKKSHSSVALKAMVTNTNSAWQFIRLYAEIAAERDYIRENSKE